MLGIVDYLVWGTCLFSTSRVSPPPRPLKGSSSSIPRTTIKQRKETWVGGVVGGIEVVSRQDLEPNFSFLFVLIGLQSMVSLLTSQNLKKDHSFFSKGLLQTQL